MFFFFLILIKLMLFNINIIIARVEVDKYSTLILLFLLLHNPISLLGHNFYGKILLYNLY